MKQLNHKYFVGQCLGKFPINELTGDCIPVTAKRKTNMIMVEVFKTNVNGTSQANMLLEQIHKTYQHYKANFDLEDCDNILRVKCLHGEIRSAGIINLLRQFGYQAEVLPDEVNALAG